MKNAFRKTILFSILLMIAVFVQSCETEIPPEDSTSPEFSFHISGDGFDQTFTQDTDLDNLQLNLRNRATYTFTFTGSDAGGVKLAQIVLVGGDDYIQLLTPVPSPWTYSSTSPLQDVIQWSGNRSNPFTGTILTGDLRATGRNIATSLKFEVVDFGGADRSSNHTSGELYLYLGEHPTEIINL